jgi:hypothetical protein
VLAVILGGTTIELLWAHGVLVALLGAPVVASVGTAAVTLTAMSWRGQNVSGRRDDFLHFRASSWNGPADGRSPTP